MPRLPTARVLHSHILLRYSALDQSGQVDRLADLHDLADVQPISDADLRAAVVELKRSTDAINKQTETLRHQHDALSRLVAKRADGESRRRRDDQACLRRSESERMRVSSEVRPFVTWLLCLEPKGSRYEQLLMHLNRLDYGDCSRPRVSHLGTKEGVLRGPAAQPIPGCRLAIG